MSENLITLGWREWVALPELGIHQIKAKVDTGARTSALHAFDVRPFTEGNLQRVEFRIHPKQRNTRSELTCVATVTDQRKVTDSGGHSEERWVISTCVTIGPNKWPIEMTLTDRDNMKFRMLLGRTALNKGILVDSSASYLVGKKRKKTRNL